MGCSSCSAVSSRNDCGNTGPVDFYWSGCNRHFHFKAPLPRPWGVVRCLLKTEADPDFKSLKDQIQLIFSYAGMKMLGLMLDFSTMLPNCSIPIPSVLAQAKKYKSTYMGIHDTMGLEEMQHARFLHPDALKVIDAACQVSTPRCFKGDRCSTIP